MSSYLIVDGIYCPEPDFDGYRAYESDLRVQITMISGRLVEERRGKVWCIDVSLSQMQDALCRRLLSALRSKGTKQVTFLPDNGGDMLTAQFLATSLTPPTLAFYDGAEPVWTGMRFTLREVRPHA